MTIAAGSRLGPYEVLSPLGAGGMGEVWKARDTRLDRDVAVKALSSELSSDASRLARFEAEARPVFTRSPYLTPEGHPLPRLLRESLGRETTMGAMSFWTDAAILGAAGMASVVFGPGGAGLHGLEEYVWVNEVQACRDALVTLARKYCV